MALKEFCGQDARNYYVNLPHAERKTKTATKNKNTKETNKKEAAAKKSKNKTKKNNKKPKKC